MLLLKYILLLHNRPLVKELLSFQPGTFLKEGYFDDKFRASEDKLRGIIRAIQLVLPFSAGASAIFFMLRPVIHQERVFILETWMADTIAISAIILASEYYLFMIIVPIITGYDSLYLASCIQVIVQLRRLKYDLRNLRADSSHKSEMKLINCIKYHQFLILTFLKMKSMYSLILLFHYIAILTTGCIELYELMGSGDHDPDVILNIFVLYCQLAYYAFPAEQIAFEFGDLSNSLYMSEWYQNTAACQKVALLLIVKSQVKEEFSGGGIIPMNLDTFGSFPYGNPAMPFELNIRYGYKIDPQYEYDCPEFNDTNQPYFEEAIHKKIFS